MNKFATQISNNLIYFPLLWISTLMFGIEKGEKILLIIVLLCALLSLTINKFSIVKYNWKNYPWIKYLLFLVLFGVISQLIHGFGSRELRALETAVILLLFLDLTKIKIPYIAYLLLVGAISALVFTYFYLNIQPTDRRLWPVNAIPFASYITLIIGCSILLIRHAQNKMIACILILAASIGVIALILTGSRGPILALICTVCLIFIYLAIRGHINWKIITIGLILITLVSVTTFTYIQKEYSRTINEITAISQGDLQTSIGLRLSVYAIGLELIKEKPLLGHGKVDLSLRWDQMLKNKEITPLERQVLSWNFHNDFIEKIVTSGILGLITMFFWLGMPIVYGIREHREHLPLVSAPPLLYFFASMTDTPSTNGSSYVTYLIFTGIILACLINSKKTGKIKEHSRA
ncbi:MAG: O-antigen ligase family protein [Psychromonas sp.]